VEPDVECHEGNLRQHGSVGQSGDYVAHCRMVHHDDLSDASPIRPACGQKALVYLYLQASLAWMCVGRQSLVLASLDVRAAMAFPRPDP
jgi:hypothetical protein